jgi:hypothetical protein
MNVKTTKNVTMIKYFLGIILLSSCGQYIKQNEKEKTIKNSKIYTDTLVYKILHFNNKKKNNEYKAATLSEQEIIKVENLLIQSIEIWNREKEKEFINDHSNFETKKNQILINLKEYKRQYTPVVNKKNEKEVLIYCACNGYFGLVQDGGKCYFKLKVNLTKMTYTKIRINGIA